MLKLKSQHVKMILPVLFLASCATGGRSGAGNSASTRSRSSASAVSPLQMKSPISDQAAIHELTGKPVSTLPSAQDLKGKPLSTQHYYAGLRAAESKNYIMAIKHFNTVLKKYPRSAEVKLAFASKAKIYKEMGLSEPASLNMRMAQSTSAKKLTRKTASAQNKASNTTTK
jgi:hypothetical protein